MLLRRPSRSVVHGEPSMLVQFPEASLVDALDRHEHRLLGQRDAAELLVERRALEEIDVALNASCCSAPPM
eukprot:7520139-Lingulodinium_polyedra.AAC.1